MCNKNHTEIIHKHSYVCRKLRVTSDINTVVLTKEDKLVQFASNRKYDVEISNTLTFIDLTVSNITVSM